MRDEYIHGRETGQQMFSLILPVEVLPPGLWRHAPLKPPKSTLSTVLTPGWRSTMEGDNKKFHFR